MTSPLKKYIWRSLFLHFLLIVMFILLPKLISKVPKPETKVTWIKLSKGSGEKQKGSPFKKTKQMPQSTVREKKEVKKSNKTTKTQDKKTVKVSKPEPPKKEAKKEAKKLPEKKVIPKKAKKPPQKTKEELLIEQALAKNKEQLKKREVEIEAAQVKEEEGGQSPDGSFDIEGDDLNPELIAYYSAIKRRINDQWVTLPRDWGDASDLKVLVTFKVDAKGQVRDVGFDEQSGDLSFDLSAKRAVERASPLPTPPDSIKEKVLEEGFLIEFNPRSIVGAGT